MGLKKLRKDTRGFTLIEIIVVLAILAILIAIAVPTMNGILNTAKEKAVYANARAAYVAYELLSVDGSPVTGETLATALGNKKDSFTVVVTKAEGIASRDVTTFWYTDGTLSEKYAKLPIGEANNSADKAASIVEAKEVDKKTTDNAKPYVAVYTYEAPTSP